LHAGVPEELPPEDVVPDDEAPLDDVVPDDEPPPDDDVLVPFVPSSLDPHAITEATIKAKAILMIGG
jgi:hypothetical protein